VVGHLADNFSFLQQPHSRGRLSISHVALKLILGKFKVFTKISNILTAFTVEDGPYNEGRSGIYVESIRHDQRNSSPSLPNISIRYIIL
jgi:hypothetical protein